MDPAVVLMKLSPRAAAALPGAVARSNRGGRNPTIRAEVLDDVARFVCDTYAPMLVARISDAFEAELGADWEADTQFVV